jgi:Mg2+ and Co2+ transporter CorA
MKHPRTRVLRKIWRMTEELELVQSISGQQQDLLRDYLCTLEPRSFRTTTHLRRARFPVEHSFIETKLRKGIQVRNRLIDLDSRLEDVSNHVSRMLEIQKENNGNAIIVFTIVTIIFLPLSWATSYLGMNTVDIRDLQQGQWLFWTIALPVTTVVIGLAVLVVLKGESIREFLIQRDAAKDRGTVNILSRSLSRRESTWPQKTTIGRSTTAWKPFARRRRTTKELGDV